MKKVLFTTYTFTMGGGSERVLSDIVNHLNPKKYDITILPYANFHVKKEQVETNVNVMPSIVDMKYAGFVEKNVKYFLVHFFPSVLRRRYIHDKYDIEISFNYQIPSFLVTGAKGAKIIQWNHGSIDDLHENWLKRKFQERSFRRADKIVVISEGTQHSVCGVFPHYADKIQLIYNGVNVERILKKSQEKTDIILKNNSIVFLGRLEKAKNPLKLLEAIRNLISLGKEINLYYLGEGEQAEEIEQRVEQWNLKDHVFLLGYQQNPYPIIKQSKAVCMLSQSEGFPTVFTEGMVLGKPFVSSNVGGVKELSHRGQCGIIVENEKECEEAIKKIVLNNEINMKMGEACRKHINDYSLKKQIEIIENLLDTI